jgi:hypothetical protein
MDKCFPILSILFIHVNTLGFVHESRWTAQR